MKKLIKKGLYFTLVFSLVVWTAGLVPANHSLATKPDDEPKITICHVTPSGQQNTLEVSEAALAGHFDASGNPLHAGDHMGACVEPDTSTSTIYAHKIVCNNESDIEWGSDGANITSTTAIDYVAQHPNCRFVEENWDFQWVIGTGGYAGDFIGPAPDWNSFDSPSTGQTPAMKVITADDLGDNSMIKVRENLKEGYIPFSFDPNGSDPAPGDEFSAEMWCHTDVLNYDNYDFVRGFELDQEYYCVAFNVLAEEVQSCGDGILDEGEQCDDSNNDDGDGCSAQCMLENTYECEDITSQDGWFGQYYNYLAEHPDMNLPSNEWPDDGHGDPLGTWDTDWYNGEYLRFIRVDSDLMFGDDFFPFDMAAEEIHNGHDYHFGAHWRTQITTDTPGDYDFSLRSDDDAWVYLNGVLVAANPGIHAPSTVNGSLSLDGDDIVDVFFAERHTILSHISFSFDNPEPLELTPMPEDCEEDPNNICGMKFYDTDQNGEYDGDDYNISGWGISLAEKLICEEGDEWADTVVDFNQGLRNDGTDVAPDRSDPNNALGEAQDDDTINFVSLGFGGTLILGFDNLIENGDGNDVEVFETTYNDSNCDSYPEYVQVYASQDGNTWEDIGNSCLDGTFDLGSLDWASYIKLVDMTNPDDFGGQVDGYDVDGVRALHCYNASQEAYETETSDDGYCFLDMTDGYYHVCEEIREGWYNSTPICQQVMISDGQDVEVNFGNYQDQEQEDGLLTICKQEDLNGDGILDDGEPVVPGWVFHIGDNEYIAENGCVFIDLPYNTYNVSEEMQEGWLQTGGEGNGVLEEDGTITTTIDEQMPNPIIYFLNQKIEEEVYCGDGEINQESEECDDGNNEDGDGCSAQCTTEGGGGGGGGSTSSSGNQNAYCGDGFNNTSSEQCDDGNTIGGDGCSAQCLIEEVLGEKIENDPPAKPPQEVLGFQELPDTGTEEAINWLLLFSGLAIILLGGTIQIFQKKRT